MNWTGTTGAPVESSPAVANGVVYVGADGIYAFDAAGRTNCSNTPKTCSPLWTGTTGGMVPTGPAVANGVVYVGSRDHKLYAFDAAGNTNCSGSPKTCMPLWTAATGDEIFSSPVVANGVVYIGSNDHKLYAFDAAGNTNCSNVPKTCAPLWTATLGSIVNSSPAVANGVVYVGSFDHDLYAFDAAGNTNCSSVPKTCSPLWIDSTEGQGVAFSSPAVANGLVYVGTQNLGAGAPGSLFTFDAPENSMCTPTTPKVCAPRWVAPTAGRIGASPAVANGRVYIGSQMPDVTSYAFDAATGAPLWTARTGPTFSSPAVADGVVYVAGVLGTFFAFDATGNTNCMGSPKTCTPLWSTPVGSNTTASPAVANGMVYEGSSSDSKLYAWGLDSVAPTTSVLLPHNGDTLRGTATLDADATDNTRVSRVEFHRTPASDPSDDDLIAPQRPPSTAGYATGTRRWSGTARTRPRAWRSTPQATPPTASA